MSAAISDLEMNKLYIAAADNLVGWPGKVKACSDKVDNCIHQGSHIAWHRFSYLAEQAQSTDKYLAQIVSVSAEKLF